MSVQANTLEIQADMAGAMAEFQRAQHAADAYFGKRFLVLSHADWLPVVGRTSVRSIPSLPVGELVRADIIEAWNDDKAAVARAQEGDRVVLEAIAREAAVARAPLVVRVDFAAPADVKVAAGTKGAHREVCDRTGQGFWHDMRLVELAMEDWPRPTIPVFARPYRKPWLVDGFAVEFRVWVRAGKVTAISNYYPQRPLVRSAQIERAMRTCIFYAEAIASEAPDFAPLASVSILASGPRKPPPSQPTFSARRARAGLCGWSAVPIPIPYGALTPAASMRLPICGTTRARG